MSNYEKIYEEFSKICNWLDKNTNYRSKLDNKGRFIADKNGKDLWNGKRMEPGEDLNLISSACTMEYIINEKFVGACLYGGNGFYAMDIYGNDLSNGKCVQSFPLTVHQSNFNNDGVALIMGKISANTHWVPGGLYAIDTQLNDLWNGKRLSQGFNNITNYDSNGIAVVRVEDYKMFFAIDIHGNLAYDSKVVEARNSIEAFTAFRNGEGVKFPEDHPIMTAIEGLFYDNNITNDTPHRVEDRSTVKERTSQFTGLNIDDLFQVLDLDMDDSQLHKSRKLFNESKGKSGERS